MDRTARPALTTAVLAESPELPVATAAGCRTPGLLVDPSLDVKVLAPDIGMTFTTLGSAEVFRVTGWLRRAPVVPPPPTGDARLDAFLADRFKVEHPEPETEYLLIHCLRDQATDVTGGSTRSHVSTPIKETACSGAYAGWCPEEVVEADRLRATACVGDMVGAYSTLPWKRHSLADALTFLPGLVVALEGHASDRFVYVHTDGHTVRGALFVTDWDRNHGHTGPDYIWVDVAKRS